MTAVLMIRGALVTDTDTHRKGRLCEETRKIPCEVQNEIMLLQTRNTWSSQKPQEAKNDPSPTGFKSSMILLGHPDFTLLSLQVLRQ